MLVQSKVPLNKHIFKVSGELNASYVDNGGFAPTNDNLKAESIENSGRHKRMPVSLPGTCVCKTDE